MPKIIIIGDNEENSITKVKTLFDNNFDINENAHLENPTND